MAPKNPKRIFDKIFYPKRIAILLSPLLDKDKSLISKIKNFFICFIYMIIFSKKYTNYELNFKILELYKLRFHNIILSGLNKFKKKKIFKLKEREFKKLQLDPVEFNHYFRFKHYGLITHNLKYLKINDIIYFLKKII